MARQYRIARVPPSIPEDPETRIPKNRLRRVAATLLGAIFTLLLPLTCLAGDWVIVRKDGTKIECLGPFLVVNGEYFFQDKDGRNRRLPATAVDAAKTVTASAGLVVSRKEPTNENPKAEISPAQACSKAVEQAFEADGVQAMALSFTESLHRGFESQLPATLRPEQRQRLIQSIRTVFSSENMVSRMTSRFLNSCDLDMLGQFTAAKTTPLGAKMTQMEVFATSPEGTRQMVEFARSLAQHPPAQQRLALVRSMDESLGCGSFMVDALMSAFRAISSGLGESTRMDQSTKAQISQTMREVSMVSLLFTYRDASDEELSRYIDLHETKALRKFNAELQNAFLEVVAEQSQEAGAALRQLMNRR